MAVMSALLGFTSERRWLRYASDHLAAMFPRQIGQPGYNKRLRKAFVLFIRVIRMLAMDTMLWSDDVWVVDSTPVECGRSRETARRSDADGQAQYGYCAGHCRYFWGLGCTWCAPCPGCRCCSPWRAPRPISARRSWTCSRPAAMSWTSIRADPHRRQGLLRPRLRDRTDRT